MDLNLKAKKNVLSELIEMMEDRELSELKGKSPKFAKVDIESDGPELVDDLKSKLMDGAEEFSKEDKLDESLHSDEPQDPEDDEDIERLKELYSKLR